MAGRPTGKGASTSRRSAGGEAASRDDTARIASGSTRPVPIDADFVEDCLLLRPTPEGVRLDRNFCKIRFRFVRPWRQIEFCKIFRRADRSRSALSFAAIGNGPDGTEGELPWHPRSQISPPRPTARWKASSQHCASMPSPANSGKANSSACICRNRTPSAKAGMKCII